MKYILLNEIVLYICIKIYFDIEILFLYFFIIIKNEIKKYVL